MTGQNSPGLIQFAKWPEKGRVKTRLARELGEARALEAHIALTTTVLDHLLATGYPLSFWWDRAIESAPPSSQVIRDRLVAQGLPEWVQIGADLGQRMATALEWGVAEHGSAIIVGSDCPAVDASYIEAARAALQTTDVVIGPADDGGFVLIGASRVASAMLDGIEWGTTRTLEQTLGQLERVGLKTHCLEPLWDVDEPEDWARFLNDGAGSRG